MQFLDGHHYADDGNADGRNLHRKALGVVGILLTERTDLVGQFFSRTSLEAPDVDEMIALVYTERRYGEALNPKSRKRASGRHNAVPSLNCRIKEEDMVLLAECANHARSLRSLLMRRLSATSCIAGFPFRWWPTTLWDSPISLTGSVRCTLSGETGRPPSSVAEPPVTGRGQASKTRELCVRIEPREA